MCGLMFSFSGLICLFFPGVCESGRAEGTGSCSAANSDPLVRGIHKERLHYCHPFRVLFFSSFVGGRERQ